LTVSNCTISGNLADFSGGGLNTSAAATLTDTTITFNVGDQLNKGQGSGGGINVAPGGTLTLDSTLVAGNTRGGPTTRDDIAGTVTATSSYNLVGDGTGLSGISDAQHHNQIGTASHPIDPKLGPLQDNGGPTFTNALPVTSTAFGKGDPTQTSSTDQRGQPRVVKNRVDVGAFEWQPAAIQAAINDVPPSGAIVGESVTLRAGFTDPNPTPTDGTKWDLVLNGSTLASGTDAAFSFTPTKTGTYQVDLVVSDNYGVSATASAFVVVSPALTGVAITGIPLTSLEGTPLTLGSSALDAASNPSLTYRWQATLSGVPVASGSTASFQFTPDHPGSYDVTLKVTDSVGESVTAEKGIDITNVAPTVDLGGTTALVQGLDFARTGSFQDPGKETWTATVDYGDGTGSQPLALNADKTFALSHHYAKGGVYLVTVSVSDGIDRGQAQLNVTVTTANVPPAHLGTAANGFTHSAENYRHFIVGAYDRYLGRGPDDQGLNFWVDRMQHHGVTDEQLEASFIGSIEYIADHGGSGAGWVRGMYHDLLGRSPGGDEVAFWVRNLQAGESTQAVALGFAASAEREGQRVQGNYRTYLGRDANSQEVGFWVDEFTHQGLTNEDLEAGFVGSPEYFNNPVKGRGDTADWVASAYADVLFRTARADEIASWVQVLS
jgi:hypothetical protein